MATDYLLPASSFWSVVPQAADMSRINGIDCGVAIDTWSRAAMDPSDLCSRILPYETEDVRDKYTLGKEIGRGSYGIVRECFDKRTGQLLACKVIRKAHLSTWQDRQVVAREVGLMQLVSGHPSIVRLQGAFEDEESITMVMEFCNGGELYNRILTQGKFSEPQAANIFRPLVDAIRFCHARGVMHRDLKPENILLHHTWSNASASGGPLANPSVKLADFGLGVVLPRGMHASSRIGSLMYEAPEVVCGKAYGFNADVWSLGVILHALLSGALPFLDQDQKKLAKKICEGSFEMRFGAWPFVSPEAKALVRRLLSVDPSRRPTAQDILNDPWLLRFAPTPSTPAPSPSSLSPSRKLPVVLPLAAVERCASSASYGSRSVASAQELHASGECGVDLLQWHQQEVQDWASLRSSPMHGRGESGRMTLTEEPASASVSSFTSSTSWHSACDDTHPAYARAKGGSQARKLRRHGMSAPLGNFMRSLFTCFFCCDVPRDLSLPPHTAFSPEPAAADDRQQQQQQQVGRMGDTSAAQGVPEGKFKNPKAKSKGRAKYLLLEEDEEGHRARHRPRPSLRLREKSHTVRA